jgi:DeoR/GlpR family transcriptional regulator of sugar metabolism
MSPADLAGRLAVSQETVRKDAMHLEGQGLVRREHGRIRLAESDVWLPISMKLSEHAQDKTRLAYAAVQLIENGTTVWIDPGTTTLALIPFLEQKENLHILTNSLAAASALANTKHTLTLCGGILQKKGQSFVGITAVQSLKMHHIHTAFLGTDGFERTDGATTFSFEEVMIKHLVLERSEKKVLMADLSKFHATGTYQYADFDAFDVLITGKLSRKEELHVSDIQKIIQISL